VDTSTQVWYYIKSPARGRWLYTVHGSPSQATDFAPVIVVAAFTAPPQPLRRAVLRAVRLLYSEQETDNVFRTAFGCYTADILHMDSPGVMPLLQLTALVARCTVEIARVSSRCRWVAP
jgi:hypothetical protein